MKAFCLVVNHRASDTKLYTLGTLDWTTVFIRNTLPRNMESQKEAFPYKKHRTYDFISKQIQQRIAATPAVMETVHPRLDLEQSSTVLKKKRIGSEEDQNRKGR